MSRLLRARQTFNSANVIIFPPFPKPPAKFPLREIDDSPGMPPQCWRCYCKYGRCIYEDCPYWVDNWSWRKD